MKNSTVIVTGGLGRVGLELAQQLESRGANAILTSRDAARVEAFNAQAEAAGLRQRARQLDPTDDSRVAEFVGAVVLERGDVHGLVNNAYCALDDRPPESVSMEDWATVARVDLGVAYRLAIELVQQQTAGTLQAVVNVSSIYGIMAPDFAIYRDGRLPPLVTYASMKAGLIQMTRYLAVYWAKTGPRVNCVTLGGVEDGQAPDFLHDYGAMVPTGRMITRREAAESICFLLGPESAGMNGTNMVVDAGRQAW